MFILSETSRFINKILKYSTKSEVEHISFNANFTDRQQVIFKLRYIKGHDIGFIADNLGFSEPTIKNELKTIRKKIEKLIS